MSIAVITGASSGFGWEFASQIDSLGFSEIWLVARRRERLEELSSTLSTPSRVVVCDLQKSEEIERELLEPLKKAGVEVSLCINNAGFGKVGAFAEIDVQEQLDCIDLNCRALVHVTHGLIPLMKKGGAFLHVSSMASFFPLGGFAVYAATKAFVTSFSIALQAELEDRDIHSMALCPGPTETEFSKRAHSRGEDSLFTHKAQVAPIVKKALNDLKRRGSLSLPARGEAFQYLLSRLLPSSMVARLSYKKIMRSLTKRVGQ